MSAKILSYSSGILTAHITGELTYPDLAALQNEIMNIIACHGSIKILVTCSDFLGWDKVSNWDDVSFQITSDPYIKKMALVGDKQWEDLALMFTGKGFREFPIEYFWTNERHQAEKWLVED